MGQDYKSGGLKLVDAWSGMEALKVTWLRRLPASGCSGWTSLHRGFIGVQLLVLSKGGSASVLLGKNMNHFWAGVFHSWHNFTRCNEPTTYGEVLQKPSSA